MSISLDSAPIDLTSQAMCPSPALDYLLFDPVPYHFPPPALPVLPALRWPGGRRRYTPAPAWARHGRLYTRARYALLDAYRLCGVGPGGGLLAPSYHCRTMLDPALALGAPVHLFALRPDLGPDLDALDRQLRTAQIPVRAVLMPHYFGLSQDLQPLARLCRQRGAMLVEDCAHALPLQGTRNGMGTTGHWCVASPSKFFSCSDGGALWAGDGSPLPPLPPLRRQGWRDELRQLATRRAHHDRRSMAPVGPPDLALDPAQQGAMAHSVRLAGPSADYRHELADQACSRVSRWIMASSDIAALVATRRRHYLAWADATAGLRHASALQPQLGALDTPYMFPLLVDAPAARFAALKRAGLPMYRWDCLAMSACSTAQRYRLGLLQLPCHQGLDARELAWLIDGVRRVLAARPQGTSA